MNRIYHTVWNAAKGQWQVAPETVKRRGKSSSRSTGLVGTMASLATGSLLLFPLGTLAEGLPSGSKIRGGEGSIEQSGQELTVNQDSDRMAIDWDSFSVGEGSRVEFIQPDSSAAALNRVTGDQLSQIRGAIEANGQVFLINPNGIVFGETAQVDVGGLVASTQDISPEDFMAGEFTFEGDSSSAIINQGNIRTADEGFVALIAAEIINQGSISAPRGDVMMGAGSRVTLDMGGPVKIEVEASLLDTYIEQGGAIEADGGRVYLTAKAAGDLAASVINHTGVTQAQTLAENEQGEIWLMGDMDNGETQVAGTLDASAPDGGDGGFVETSAAKVSIVDEATVTTRADDGQTGEWLIDPQDYTVAEEDGDITGNTLSNNLADNNVTIESIDGGEDGNGDIFVNDEVTWESGNTLTLNAQRDIEINAEMDASEGNGGKLALEYGQDSTDGGSALFTANAPVDLQAGQNLSAQLGSDGEVLDFIVITELGDETGYADGTLQAMRDDLEGHYALGADIDASDTANWDGDEGWEPVGSSGGSFDGSFDGLGHDISNLTINRPNEDDVGFFGGAYSGSNVLQNINLINLDVSGGTYVGGLAGLRFNGIIHNSYASGSVKGEGEGIGGLVGGTLDASVQKSSADTNVSGNMFVGGLVGSLGTDSDILNSYATGAVQGNEIVGGLAGGVTTSSVVENSYAAGDVSGESKVGGLIGRVGNPGSSVSATVVNNYATGKVTGDSSIGGLLGSVDANDNIENNFWDVESSGIGSAGDVTNGATGLTSTEMRETSNFTDAGWDENIWSFGGARAAGYGVFRPYLTNVTRDEDIPDQTTLFEDGFGTEDQPFTLTDWQQLQNINFNNEVLSGGFYYALLSDLDTDTSGYDELASAMANEGKGWKPIGNDDNQFTGTFDGLDHTLSDVHIDRPDENFVGFFGRIISEQNGPVTTIRNLGLDNAEVTGDTWVGSLIGYADYADVERVFSSDVTVNADSVVGGLIGYIWHDDGWTNALSLTSSYSSGTVNAAANNSTAGGLVGEAYSNGGPQIRIEDSYSSAEVNGTDYLGGLVASVNAVTIKDSYASGAVNGSGSTLGGLVSYDWQDSGGVFEVVDSFWDIETTGIGEAGDDNFGATGLTSAEMQQAAIFADAGWDEDTWSLGGNRVAGYGAFRPYLTNVTSDGDIPDQNLLFDDGFGTADQPFTLTDWQQLQNINVNEDVLTGGHYFRLVSSLDAGSEGYTDLASASANGGKGWNPIGDGSPPDNGPIFTGQFDGGDNTIGDLTVADGRYNLGLFGFTTGASISNLTLHNPDVSTTGFSYGVGALAGRIQDTTVDNVTVSGDQAEVKGYFETGGLIGSASESSINNSSSAASVAGDPASFNAGGLIGYSSLTRIADSSASGAVSGGAHVGGLAGRNTSDSQILNSQATGDVTIPDSAEEVTRGYAGGFVGRNEGTIENASASGDVTGLIGDEFAGDNLGVGSFAGDNSGTLSDVEAGGAVTVEDATDNETAAADGLLGRNTGLLANGLAVDSNTAHWLQNEASFLISSQPADNTEIASDDLRERLDSGVNVAIATTGDGHDITAQDPVDLGNADQHSALLSLETEGGVALESTQALRLGEVNAADAINIATEEGNLYLAGDLSTADTSSQALVLAAGRGEDAGSETGGNIRYTSGDLITGDGGRAELYTGNLSGSEDIAQLIETGNFRYNSNETNSNFTAALDGTRHLIYREQPTILVNAQGDTITYGDAVPTEYTPGSRGFVNGDDADILEGNAAWSVADDLSGAGFQVAGNHRIDYTDGLTNSLGYAIANDGAQPGELTVDPLTLTATDIAEGGSVYGETLSPGDVTLDGTLSGDDLSSEAELADPALSSSDEVNAGTYDQQADTDNLGGADAGNYTLDSFTEADSYVVDPRAITVTPDDATKIYGEDDPNFTWRVTDGNLVGDDTLTGDVSRESGEALGRYAIQQGDVSSAQNPNYDIQFVEGELRIGTAAELQPELFAATNASFDAAVNQALEDALPDSSTAQPVDNAALPGGIRVISGGINVSVADVQTEENN